MKGKNEKIQRCKNETFLLIFKRSAMSMMMAPGWFMREEKKIVNSFAKVVTLYWWC